MAPVVKPNINTPKIKSNVNFNLILDSTQDVLGCKHYRRNCQIIAPCCNNKYSCRVCHDEQEDHRINRFDIKRIICLNCNNEQGVQKYCDFCDTSFGFYFCEICCFFDDTNKQQFHCDKCGICRKGRKENFFHCDDCNGCLHKSVKDTHVCKDMTEVACPICMEELITSTKPYIHNNKCSHHIHEDCLSIMLQNGNYKCPICRISLIDMSELNKILDLEVKNTVMPIKHQNININIQCNDCQYKCSTFYHIVGHKCLGCGSYNTQKY